MINGKLRGEWGFDGFVVSDCDALSDGASHHYIQTKFNGSLEVQAQQALRGGTDINCGGLYGEQAAAAVQQGLVEEHELDVALVRLWTKAFKLGVVDQGLPSNPNPFAHLGAEAVDAPNNRALALEAALQGVVLLKNDAATLPLDRSKVKKLALIGPHANGSFIFLGGPNYHGDNSVVLQNTPPLRAEAWLPDAQVAVEQGCSVAGNDTSGIARAVSAAGEADAVVLFLGLDKSIENEGTDRATLELPGVQSRMALAVARASAKPVVVVLVNGGPLAVRELKESGKVGAIVEAFFPGQYAAEAIMQLILGEASFSGLLPVTVYDKDYVTRRPITNLDLRGAGGVTYRYFEGTPLWPFGFGLSYGDVVFSGDAAAVVHTSVGAVGSQPVCFNVTVHNRGGLRTDVAVLAFVESDHADAPRNSKLADFVRESAVEVGEWRKVQLCVDKALPLVDAQGLECVLEGEYRVIVGVKDGVGGAGAGTLMGTVIVHK